MLESNANLRYQHDLLRLRMIMHSVDKFSVVGPNSLNFFSKDSYLCGLRAQCFSSLFNHFSSPKKNSPEFTCIGFIYHKCPNNLESLNFSNSDYLNNYAESFINGTHAIVICCFAGRFWLVDPTIAIAIPGDLSQIMESALHKTSQKFSASIVNLREENIIKKTDYSWFYRTQWFYTLIDKVTFGSVLDQYCDYWIKLKLNLRIF